jgi:glycosyltransferase involved in cell wall biosynthesis
VATILVISLSDLAADPRVDRQIDFLRSAHRVIAAGLAPPAYDDVDYIELEQAPLPRYPLFVAKRGIAHAKSLAGLHERAYWSEPSLPVWRELLRGVRADLAIVNDAAAVPLAFSIPGEMAVVFDAHEHALSDYETSWRWRVLARPRMRWIQRTYMPRLAGMMVVSQGIANLYERDLGLPTVVVTNAPRFERLAPSEVGDPVRIVHFGVADPQRRLDLTIEAMRRLPGDYLLDLVLVGGGPFATHAERLRRLAAGDDRISFLQPVPMRELVRFANAYDIGVFLLPALHANQRFVLPNKFFEYIQARIPPAIGPSPEMARIVREWDCGIVAEEATPEALAAAIAGTPRGRLAELKRNCDSAAQVLCAERNAELVLGLVDRALGSVHA